jgi:hypothetical protein
MKEFFKNAKFGKLKNIGSDSGRVGKLWAPIILMIGYRAIGGSRLESCTIQTLIFAFFFFLLSAIYLNSIGSPFWVSLNKKRIIFTTHFNFIYRLASFVLSMMGNSIKTNENIILLELNQTCFFDLMNVAIFLPLNIHLYRIFIVENFECVRGFSIIFHFSEYCGYVNFVYYIYNTV